jgi:hypothetical protein
MTSRLFIIPQMLPTFAPGTHNRGMCPHKGVVNALLNGKTPTIQVLTVDVVIASLLQLQGINHVETFREKKMTSNLLPTPTGTDYKSRGPNSKQVGIDNFFKINPSYSQAVSPASLSPVQEKEKEQAMTATSGLICYESSKSSIPDGSLRRMSEVLLTSKTWWNRAVTLEWKMTPITEEKTVSQQAHLFASSMTLNKQVIQSKYFLYQLAVSGRAINGTDCGLLPVMLKTPSAVETEGGTMEVRPWVNAHYKLRDQIAMLPTPKSQNANSPGEHGQGGKDLQTVIGLLPTPATRDYKGANGPLHMEKDRPHINQLPSAITYGTNRGLKLHSDFVSWMQGYPLDWMDV